VPRARGLLQRIEMLRRSGSAAATPKFADREASADLGVIRALRAADRV
jgi:hypothetical protein